MHLKKVFEITLSLISWFAVVLQLEFGYAQVFINTGFVVIAFLLFGAVLIWLDRLMRAIKPIV